MDCYIDRAREARHRTIRQKLNVTPLVEAIEVNPLMST